ncbi:MAG: FIST N-terminal domain-containing protein [Myxococcales bacterium]
MRWASALSQKARLEDAMVEAATSIRAALGEVSPDLVAAFVSAHHRPAYVRLSELIRRELPGSFVLGCTAFGVIGAGREVEGEPALSLTAASLPGVELQPFRVEKLPRAGVTAEELRKEFGIRAARPHLLLLADPLTVDAANLVSLLDVAYPGMIKIGGLASGGSSPGENRLFLGEEALWGGAVGVALSGNLAVDTIVAQGCRPIGHPMIVTRCEGNIVHELDGKPPLAVLRELFETLPERDRELFQHSLFAGVEMRQDQVEYREGELLVRNLVGADSDTGSLAIGAEIQPMQVVQFLLRDARTAEEDLARLLDRSKQRGASPRGALLFSCVGRGAHLFGKPDHDSDLFKEKVGPVPLGGFFCNGEIGPVGGSTFLHGYTSAFALFREGR